MQTIYSGGGAQTVEVYAQDHEKRPAKPSAATARIVDLTLDDDDPDRVVLATSAATVDSVSTTTTAYAGRGASDPRLMVLTSAASVTVGVKYLLSYAGGSEAVLIERINGTSVYARDPIRGPYSTGATFVGLRVTATFPSAWANDADQLERDPTPIFGVDWVFTGITGDPRARTLAAIEPRGLLARVTVTDLFEIDPQLAATTHSRTKLESHIKHADREITAKIMHARGNRPSEVLDGEVGALAVAWRAVELAYGVLENHTERRDWAGLQAKAWERMLLDGRKRVDAVETPIATDRTRPTRSSIGVVSIRGGA